MSDDSLILACPACNKMNRVGKTRLADGPKCGHCGSALFLNKPLELTSANFSAHVSKSELPIVIDFWAPWCGPCQQMAPAFAQAATELEPYIRAAKIDTEAEQMLGMQFGIRSIPTMIVFHKGKEIARTSGAMPARQIVVFAKQGLANL